MPNLMPYKLFVYRFQFTAVMRVKDMSETNILILRGRMTEELHEIDKIVSEPAPNAHKLPFPSVESVIRDLDDRTNARMVCVRG